MKTAKLVKALSLILASLLLLLSAASCGGKESDTDFTVGICNYVDDASLNQIADNIQTQLKKNIAAAGKTVRIDYQNCNADANVMNQIIAGFVADKVDLMVGIATPVAMAMQAATEDNNIPVIFAAVSDPVGVGLVDSLATPGHNVTGSSDYLDTTAVMNLMLAINPSLSKVGLLYDVGQDASTAPIAAAKSFLADKGISYVEYTGRTVDEVSLAVSQLVQDGVEAVFTPTDNTIMKAELTIYEALAEAKIPHYTGADSFALNGAFLGYGVDYANLGVKTADMIASVLLEGKAPALLSVLTFDNGTATVNTETCAAIGLDFETVKTAITPYCLKINTIVTADDFSDLAE